MSPKQSIKNQIIKNLLNYKWVAIDKDGCIYAFTERPYVNSTAGQWHSDKGTCSEIGKIEDPLNFRWNRTCISFKEVLSEIKSEIKKDENVYNIRSKTIKEDLELYKQRPLDIDPLLNEIGDLANQLEDFKNKMYKLQRSLIKYCIDDRT